MKHLKSTDEQIRYYLSHLTFQDAKRALSKEIDDAAYAYLRFKREFNSTKAYKAKQHLERMKAFYKEYKRIT